MSHSKGWVGVDLDATLAQYDHWRGVEHIGKPVPAMLERVRAWVASGQEVRIFTARAFRMLSPEGSADRVEGERVVARIHEWLAEHGLPLLAVTCVKDFGMIELWDDRCIQVIPNTGARADGKEMV